MPSDIRFSGARVLVTGASGFIGSHLCPALLESGAEVHGVSRHELATLPGNLSWWHLDLADCAGVQQLVLDVKPDFIFHLASHVIGSRELDCVIPTFRSNLTSTVNLLTAAAKTSCRRFLLTGSLEEPDHGDPEAVACSPYAIAKWASSAYARMFFELYRLPTVVLRLFMVYGPAQQDLRKLIPYVTLSLLRGESPKIGSGHRLVDWIYVDDVIKSLIAAALAPSVEGCTVEIGSGQLVSIRDVVERLAKIVNPDVVPLFGMLPDRPREPVRVAKIAKSYALIGWKPETSLQEGLKRTSVWYGRQVREGKL